jgi:hypothetical protein
MAESSRRGGERDQPRNIPVAGEVLRREVLRLGFARRVDIQESGGTGECCEMGGVALQWMSDWGTAFTPIVFFQSNQGAWTDAPAYQGGWS